MEQGIAAVGCRNKISGAAKTLNGDDENVNARILCFVRVNNNDFLMVK
jgi:hypothetical protein